MIIKKLQKNGSKVSLFIEPKIKDISLAKKYFNSDSIEIHTGKICNLINENKKYQKEYTKIKKAVKYASTLNLNVHAGHGITYESVKILKKIDNIKEFNIGHFLIGESIFLGLRKSINNFKKLIN